MGGQGSREQGGEHLEDENGGLVDLDSQIAFLHSRGTVTPQTKVMTKEGILIADR